MSSDSTFFVTTVALAAMLLTGYLEFPEVRSLIIVAAIMEASIVICFWRLPAKRLCVRRLSDMVLHDEARGTCCYAEDVNQWYRLERKRGRTANGTTVITSVRQGWLWVSIRGADTSACSTAHDCTMP